MKPGDRVTVSTGGAQRGLKIREGIIVGESHNKAYWRVQWDGLKTAHSVAKNFVIPASRGPLYLFSAEVYSAATHLKISPRALAELVNAEFRHRKINTYDMAEFYGIPEHVCYNLIGSGLRVAK